MPWYLIYRLNLYENKTAFQDLFERNFDQIEIIVSGDQYAPNRKGGATE